MPKLASSPYYTSEPVPAPVSISRPCLLYLISVTSSHTNRVSPCPPSPLQRPADMSEGVPQLKKASVIPKVAANACQGTTEFLSDATELQKVLFHSLTTEEQALVGLNRFGIVFLKWQCPQHCLFWLLCMFFLHRGTAAGYSVDEVIGKLLLFASKLQHAIVHDDAGKYVSVGFGGDDFETPKADRVRAALARCVADIREHFPRKVGLAAIDLSYSDADRHALHVLWQSDVPIGQRLNWEALKWAIESKIRRQALALVACLSDAYARSIDLENMADVQDDSEECTQSFLRFLTVLQLKV